MQATGTEFLRLLEMHTKPQVSNNSIFSVVDLSQDFGAALGFEKFVQYCMQSCTETFQ